MPPSPYGYLTLVGRSEYASQSKEHSHGRRSGSLGDSFDIAVDQAISDLREGLSDEEAEIVARYEALMGSHDGGKATTEAIRKSSTDDSDIDSLLQWKDNSLKAAKDAIGVHKSHWTKGEPDESRAAELITEYSEAMIQTELDSSKKEVERLRAAKSGGPD